MTLSTLLASARLTLQDPSGTRFDDTALTEAVRLTLAEYNRANPQVRRQVITLSSSGRTVSLAGIDGLVSVVRVMYPYGQAAIRQPYQIQTTLTSAVIVFTGELAPAPGEMLCVEYTTCYTLAGLDGAETTTFPAAHLDLLAQGVVGIALILHAQSLVEAYGGRPADIEKLTDLSTAFLEAFRKSLPHLQATQQAEFPPGFPLDSFDNQPKAVL